MNQTVGIFRVERIHYPLGPLSQQDLHYFSADLTNSSTNVLVTEKCIFSEEVHASVGHGATKWSDSEISITPPLGGCAIKTRGLLLTALCSVSQSVI